jgi:hypothetical protein
MLGSALLFPGRCITGDIMDLFMEATGSQRLYGNMNGMSGGVGYRMKNQQPRSEITTRGYVVQELSVRNKGNCLVRFIGLAVIIQCPLR